MPEAIYHIVDDQKFIDAAATQFDTVAPGLNRYVIPGRPRPLKHITRTSVSFERLERLTRLLGSRECTAVVFHSLPPHNIRLVDQVHARAPVTWIGWGYDYYDTLLASYYPDGTYLPLTRSAVAAITRPSVMQRIATPLKSGLKSLLRYPSSHPPITLSRIDFFCPVLPVEYDMAVRANPQLTARYVRWNYQNWLLSSVPPISQSSACNILVGNSASPHNNHLDVFDILSRSSMPGDSTIIVPLSYGSPRYAHEVMRRGTRLFGDRFRPLVEWIPFEEYLGMLSSCSTAFFGAVRQHAAGNVSQLLAMGARVYMHPRSPLFGHYSTLGAYVAALDPTTTAPQVPCFERLASHDAEHNRRVVLDNRDPHFSRTTSLVDAMLNHPRRGTSQVSAHLALC